MSCNSAQTARGDDRARARSGCLKIESAMSSASPKPGRIKYPGEDQEQARADQARDQVAEPGRPANGDAELGEEPAPDPGADHAEDDVGEDANIAAGDLLRQPARHAADQDSGNPTDPSLVHRPSP